MAHRRAHVVLPDDLISEIDQIVGARGRSAFLAGIARKEVRRLRLLQLLQQTGSGWKDADHPELKQGAAAWVSRLRSLDRKREAQRARR
jgi:metal-responsive CopG/Arc/MetJ family transcriptional regulator